MNEKTLIWGEKHKSKYIFLGIDIVCGIALLYFLVEVGLLFNDDMGFWLVPLLLTIFFALCYKSVSNSELVVTNKRIYGITTFNKRIDLPLDSVSAIGTDFLHGICISTSSGKIHFKCVKNNIEIHDVVSELITDRQQTKESNLTQNVQNSSDAYELKKFKELLDSGIITQEEFDEKKKQLLGL